MCFWYYTQELNTYRFPREKILIPNIFWTHYDYDYKYGAFTINGCLDIEVTNLYLILGKISIKVIFAKVIAHSKTDLFLM